MNNNIQPQQQQQQVAQGGGFSLWKMILLFLGIQWVINNVVNKQTPKGQYFNILSPNDLFDIKLTSNISNWTMEWNDIAYHTDSILTQNITIKGSDLLLNPKITITIKGQDLFLQSGIPLTDYKKIKKDVKMNLLFDSNEEYMIKKQESKEEDKYEWHFKSKVYILMIYDANTYPMNQIPPQLKYQLKNDDGMLVYYPIIDVDNFFLRRKDYLLIDPNEIYEIPIEFNCYWVWKYLMTDSIKNAGRQYETMGLDYMFDETSQDQTKEMLFETNIVLVVVTMVVSLLHTIFSTLAIKNDYQYWKNLESHEGISIRSLYINFIIDIIITLYLLDQDTSYIIIIQQFVELGLMVWKILKTTKFRRIAEFPYLAFDHQKSYMSKTQEFDQQAARYLYYLLIPLFACYLVYAIVYQEHKGFYSFILEALVGFIYIFGFINMTPQLYINYKLKSVAHLPWKYMIYRFLNTIIDDLFAFIITMPWLKRLSCFRDDIIFLIYIYQRRIYRVDMKRTDCGMERDVTQKDAVNETTQKELSNKDHLKQD